MKWKLYKESRRQVNEMDGGFGPGMMDFRDDELDAFQRRQEAEKEKKRKLAKKKGLKPIGKLTVGELMDILEDIPEDVVVCAGNFIGPRGGEPLTAELMEYDDKKKTITFQTSGAIDRDRGVA